MTPAAPALAPLRERLTAILAALAEGMRPADDCTACRAAIADRCDDCARGYADAAAAITAITAVQDAPTGDEALAASLRCLIGLMGIPADEWSVEITGTEGGEAR